MILLVAGLALTLVEPRASHPIPEAQSTGSDNHDPGAGQGSAGLDAAGLDSAEQGGAGQGGAGLDAGQGGAGQGGAGQDAAGQGGTRQGGAGLDAAGLDAGQDAAGQGSAGQGDAGQGSAGQDAGQGGTEQDAAGQVQDAGAAPGTDEPSGADAAAIPSGAARDTSLSTDPAIALGGLATLRAEAFATANPSLLSAVDVEGSPAITEDRAALQALAESGTTLQDLTIAIVQPAVLDPPARAALPALAGLPAVADAPKATEVALVRATAALSPYTEAPSGPLGGDGGPSSRGASRQDMIFVLWNSGDGWRIHSTVTPPT